MVVVHPKMMPENLGRRETVTRAELSVILGGPVEWIEVARRNGVHRFVMLKDRDKLDANGLPSLAAGFVITGPVVNVLPEERIV